MANRRGRTRRLARSAAWRKEFSETLTDLADDDIGGSGFAITGYTVHEDLGGDAALARLRDRLRRRGVRLILDFVPNHTGLDHPWVQDHPEFYIAGTELDLAREPHNYTWIKRKPGDLLLAYGRDPYFPGWPDALQLDYSNPATQEAMIGELLKIADQCDGVRCDMAMLVLPDVFERTWGKRAPLFWPTATRRVREKVPEFCFMAEVYWDLEWTVQQQGFDYAYDKRLYDRLREGHVRPVREHLYAGLDYQTRLARFLENHDEPRAATAFPDGMHQAAAIITFLSPGLRFFHQGEFEGARSAFLRTCGAGRTKRSIHNCKPSTTACLACFANRSFEKAVGNSRSARPPGTAIGPTIASSLSLGKTTPTTGSWRWSTIRPTKASATSASRSKAWPIANGGSRTCFARQATTATAATCRHADSTSTLRRGEAPSSSSHKCRGHEQPSNQPAKKAPVGKSRVKQDGGKESDGNQ